MVDTRIWRHRVNGAWQTFLGSNLAAINPPVAGFTASVNGNTVLFDATPSTPGNSTITDYFWNFGDGTYGTASPVSHQYAQPGRYTVTLTITCSDGSKDSQTYFVTVAGAAAPPTVRFTPVVSGLTVSVTAITTGAIDSYLWDFGDGQRSGSQSTTHTYATGGTYTIQVEVVATDAQGAVATQSVVVGVVNKPPVASFTTSFPVTGDPSIISFDGSASSDPEGGAITYSWNFGDGSGKPTTVSGTHDYTTSGTYTITLTVTDPLGATGTAFKQLAITQPTSLPPYTIDDGLGSNNGLEPTGYVSYNTVAGSSFFRRLAAAQKVVSVGPGTFTIPGFSTNAQDADHLANPSNGFIGAGSSKTIITMAANSASGATYSAASGFSDPYLMGRFYNNAAGSLLQDFTLQGTTPQTIPNTDTSVPHSGDNMYGGFNLTGNGWTLKRIKIKGIPGNYQAPPGETFPLSFFKAYGTITLQDVEIDGQGISASNFGLNGSGNSSTVPTTLLQVTRLHSHDNPYSGGVAWWQTNFDPASFMDDSSFNNCRCFWNLERCSGTVTLHRPRIGALQTKGAGVTAIFCESDGTWGATAGQAFQFIIRDPRDYANPNLPYSGPKIGVQFGRANDKGTNYYGRNNFKAYDANGVDITSTFYSFGTGGFN